MSAEEAPEKRSFVEPKPDAPWLTPAFLWCCFKVFTLRGVCIDIKTRQKTDSILNVDSWVFLPCAAYARVTLTSCVTMTVMRALAAHFF
jgi:hypothetical protein